MEKEKIEESIKTEEEVVIDQQTEEQLNSMEECFASITEKDEEIKNYKGDNDNGPSPILFNEKYAAKGSVEMDEIVTIDEDYEDGPRIKTNDTEYDQYGHVISTNRVAKQWSLTDNRYQPVSNTVPVMESGYYTFNSNPQIGFYFEKKDVNLNKLFYLPNKASETIMKDIADFWTLEDKYKKYERVFKRNYLLYSAPGTGKTSIINLMCKHLIEQYKGVVFMVNSDHELANSIQGLQIMHRIEPHRKMIMVIEDIDNFISRSGRGEWDGYLLNLLDGNIKIPNLVIIATTNYIEQLEARYTNRPSRFDRVLEYPLPNEESRKIFIENTILPDDLKSIDINEWVKKTKGYTIDHINEVVVLHFIHDYSEKEAFETVDKMVNDNDKLKNKDSVDGNKHRVGFRNSDYDGDCEWTEKSINNTIKTHYGIKQ